MDLQLSCLHGEVPHWVSQGKRGATNAVVATDRVYEYHYLRGILQGSFARVSGSRHKTNSDSVTRLHLEELIFAFSYKFMVNKSVEVDYYKIRCTNGFRILIPRNFSQKSGEYLE